MTMQAHEISNTAGGNTVQRAGSRVGIDGTQAAQPALAAGVIRITDPDKNASGCVGKPIG